MNLFSVLIILHLLFSYDVLFLVFSFIIMFSVLIDFLFPGSECIHWFCIASKTVTDDDGEEIDSPIFLFDIFIRKGIRAIYKRSILIEKPSEEESDQKKSAKIKSDQKKSAKIKSDQKKAAKIRALVFEISGELSIYIF